MGKPDQDLLSRGFSGAPEPFRIGIYMDHGVSESYAQEIVQALESEFAPYGIKIEIPWTRPWQRKGFQAQEIMSEISKLPLEFPCDRILVIIGRNAGDVVWGLFLPEILGAVEDATRTKGYVVGKVGSLNQIILSPTNAATHEVYHMLGCNDGQGSWEIYSKVVAMRSLAQENRHKKGQNFFPSITPTGRIFFDRKEVELALDKAVFK
jgi:hypothetical protein